MNKIVAIFAILMLIGGVGYNVYYFKVGKQKRVMKTLGRTQSQSQSQSKPAQQNQNQNPGAQANSAANPNPAANPAGNSSPSTPPITTDQGGETMSQSNSDRITLPLSSRLFKSALASLDKSDKSLTLEQNSLASLAKAPPSNRNPFFTVEEEKALKGKPSAELKPKPNSNPKPIQETSDKPQPDTPIKGNEKPQPEPESVKPTGVQLTDVNVNVERRPPALPNLKLSAIIVSGDRKVAVIEGQRVIEGSIIGMEKVVEIKADRVVLQSGQNRRELALAKNRSAPLIMRKDR